LKIKTPKGVPISNAAITWAINQPGVTGVNITIPDREHLDEYLAASGRQLSYLDHNHLALFRAATSKEYCRVGCGLCIDICPHGVDIACVLRCDQYRRDYDMHDFARERYFAFPEKKRPIACLSCESAYCEGVCPFGISIRSRLVAAHGHLDSTKAALS